MKKQKQIKDPHPLRHGIVPWNTMLLLEGLEKQKPMKIDWKKLALKLQSENILYRRFYAVWNRCESTRGCYSCSDPHDCRCPISRDPDGKTWRKDLAPWMCECGRDELEALESKIDELESCREVGKGG